MEFDPTLCFAALRARDSRFDGIFFTAVRTTGIYCRPICPSRIPSERNCTFFDNAAAAERAGFRPCIRCRPELAPGRAAVDARSRLTRAAVDRIQAGYLNDHGVSDLSADLGVSSRHLRRVLRSELGVTPVELAQTRRLAVAKQLLQDSRIPIGQVAYASGFSSLRRFNALFRDRFSRPPSALRRNESPEAETRSLTLRLDFRPPLAWDATIRFLGARATQGVEQVREGVYHRWVDVGNRAGWVSVSRAPGRFSLDASIPVVLVDEVAAIVAGLRRLFDLDARPDVIENHLASDPSLRPRLHTSPGLRVPGAYDPFEVAVRAILGQQVSVARATQLAGRFVARFGSAATSDPDSEAMSSTARGTTGSALPPGHTFPSASVLARVSGDEIARIGMPRSRGRAIAALARAVDTGEIDLAGAVDPEECARSLRTIPGVGPWTAQYILMRAIQWPNAFPAGDLALRRTLGLHSPAEMEKRARAWEPWRSYAAIHLWNQPVPGGE